MNTAIIENFTDLDTDTQRQIKHNIKALKDSVVLVLGRKKTRLSPIRVAAKQTEIDRLQAFLNDPDAFTLMSNDACCGQLVLGDSKRVIYSISHKQDKFPVFTVDVYEDIKTKQ